MVSLVDDTPSVGVRPLVVFGDGGHARVVADAARASGRFEVLGFLGPAAAVERTVALHELLGEDSDIVTLASAHPGLVGAIGVGSSGVRRRIAEAAAAATPEFQFVVVAHPAAVIAASASLSPGAFIAAGAIVGVDARIGAHAVVNTRASIDHDCVVGDYADIAPGVTLCGGVRVGAGAFIGVGAAVAPNLAIGDGAIVGAGAIVLSEVRSGARAFGAPARVMERST